MQDELVKLISTARHNYAGQWYYIGDELSVTKADADDLIAAGFATPAPVELEQPKDKRHYKRRDMEAE